jgi:hypothetical protein
MTGKTNTHQAGQILRDLVLNAAMPSHRSSSRCGVLIPMLAWALICGDVFAAAQLDGLHVGTAAVELEADDSMVIAGGITPGKAAGQEGKLRVVAVVLEKPPFGKLAIAACDILMITRTHLDPVVAEIEKTTGIPSTNILINCTHTHHAPSTMVLHGYGLDDTFTKRVQRAIVKAAAGKLVISRWKSARSTSISAKSKPWGRTAGSCWLME